MKRFFYLLFLVVISYSIHAQTNQIQRAEFELEGQKGEYKTIPVKENGILLFAESNKSTRELSTWMFSLYNTEFSKKWTKEIAVNGRLGYNGYSIDNQFLYMLFTNYRSDEFSIVKIDVSSGNVKEIKGTYLKKYSIQSFKAKNDQVYIDGLYKGKAALGYLDLSSATFKLIPITFNALTSIENISFERESDLVSVVFLNWVKKNSFLSIHTFKNGIRQSAIEIHSEKNVTSARLNILANGDKLVLGTYSEGGRNSNGMYICKFVEDKQQFIKFYNFKDLKNFLSYLPIRTQEKLKEKMERKESQGKEFNFSYNLLVHDIIERENEYLLIAEAYYATYRTETYTTMVAGPNGTMRTVTQTRQVFDGWLYTHALIGGFSKEGELRWDNTFEMGDYKSFLLKERITVNNTGKNILLTYGTYKAIKTKVIEGNNVVDKKETVIIETLSEEDKVRYSTADIEFWYDRYFIAFGHQKIKNKEMENSKRYVFYLNKVAMNSRDE